MQHTIPTPDTKYEKPPFYNAITHTPLNSISWEATKKPSSSGQTRKELQTPQRHSGLQE